jgi:hypothetical protein
MADRIVMLLGEDEPRAREIIDEFAARTGLEPFEIEGGMEFPLSDEDHGIRVVETLNEVASDWSDHIVLGDPAEEED